ncbi:ArsR/SmtB family transcription factor [Aurantibacillus circumpalustris]|uniref:ArsR/SmtB family transcription factor n=1 Tax=Aurantibacillus circumpalustris TaxID=3036359 RepID=UPI00295BB057|nr:metalloregulator ArsR/SmtB family transcription factor [Aurantibacillus circumpalustris]
MMKLLKTDPFQAVADSNRREILHLLSKENYSINSLVNNFDMSRPAVSKHIKILNKAGFISIKDVGRERICSLKKEGFKDLQHWMNFFDKFWNSKLDLLGDFLHTTQKTTPKK